MTIVRNISGQPVNLNRKGGVIQLFPRRAVTISAEELNLPQVQSLLQNGFLRLEKIEKKKTGTLKKPVKEKVSVKNDEKKESEK